jgi:hypothetical protein
LSFSHQLKCTQTRSIQEAWWFSARAASKHVFCSVANTFVYCLTASIILNRNICTFPSLGLL